MQTGKPESEEVLGRYAVFRDGMAQRQTGRDELLVLLAKLITRIEENFDLWEQLGRVVSMNGIDRLAMNEIEKLMKEDAA